MKRAEFLPKLHSFADSIAEKIADFVIKDTDEGLVSLNLCIDLAKQERAKNPQIKNFILSIEADGIQTDKEEALIVKLIFLDGERQPVALDETKANGYVFRAKAANVDKKILDLLNGKQSVIVHM